MVDYQPQSVVEIDLPLRHDGYELERQNQSPHAVNCLAKEEKQRELAKSDAGRHVSHSLSEAQQLLKLLFRVLADEVQAD